MRGIYGMFAIIQLSQVFLRWVSTEKKHPFGSKGQFIRKRVNSSPPQNAVPKTPVPAVVIE